MSERILLAWIDLEPGDREIWLAHAQDLVKASNDEPGCVWYAQAADPNSATAVIGQSIYRDAAAFDAHLSSEHQARFSSLTDGCRVRERRVHMFDGTRVA